MTNLLSDEPATNSIMPKVIIHVLNVRESLGLDGFQKYSKTNLFWPNRETNKILAKGKMAFDQALKGLALGHIKSIFFTFRTPGRGYIKRQSKFQSKTLFSQVFVFGLLCLVFSTFFFGSLQLIIL